MGSIDMIKPLSTVLRSAVNKSQQHQEKNSWERRVSNPGLQEGAASSECSDVVLVLLVDFNSLSLALKWRHMLKTLPRRQLNLYHQGINSYYYIYLGTKLGVS